MGAWTKSIGEKQMNKIIVINLVLFMFVSAFGDELDDYLKVETVYMNKMLKAMEAFGKTGDLLKKKYPNDRELRDFIDGNDELWTLAIKHEGDNIELVVALFRQLRKYR